MSNVFFLTNIKNHLKQNPNATHKSLHHHYHHTLRNKQFIKMQTFKQFEKIIKTEIRSYNINSEDETQNNINREKIMALKNVLNIIHETLFKDDAEFMECLHKILNFENK